MKNPIQQFAIDRAHARKLGDLLVDRCFVASVDADGNPQVRTLVLRDIEGALAIFCNATSCKVSEIRNSDRVAILVYWPSVNVQYRMSVRVEALNDEVVKSHWRQKPVITKKLDWFYERHPQSSGIDSRGYLLQAILEMDEPVVAPPSAMALEFQPVLVERLNLDTDEGIHDRQQYALEDGSWTVKTIVP